MELWIDNRDERFEVTDELRAEIQRALEQALAFEGVEGNIEISLSFVDAEEIRQLNRDFRGVNQVTDVLSFPLEDVFSWEEQARPLGDIVVCMDRVIEQAQEFGHSRQREILYLCVHSLLHLLGYDHVEEEERREMRAHEDAVMQALGVLR